MARFNVPYQNGVLKAIAYNENDEEIGAVNLRTADEKTELRLIPETETVKHGKLTYVKIRFTDANGIWKPMGHHSVNVKVKNGSLIRLGSACPYNSIGFLKDTVETYYGEALAIIRADGEGDVLITATSDSYNAELVISVK